MSAPVVVSGRYGWLWLALLIALSVYVCIHGADDYHYSADEAVIANMAEGKTASEVWQFSHYEAPSPLGNLLRHYWMAFSDKPEFVRLGSLVCGVIVILLYYRIGLLLGGELCAMACAALVAFSHGWIIQSYVVRNYCIFVLLLSAAFYYYLRWRGDRSPGALAGYAFWGALAALTHISAVFAVASIGLFELSVLWRGGRARLQWVLANGIIVLVAGIVYGLWHPLLEPLRGYFVQYAHTPLKAIRFALFYPLAQVEYIYPDPFSAIALLICLPVFAYKWRGSEQGSLLRLSLVVMAVGMVLLATNIYPYFGTHRGIWALPFLIIGAGVLVARLAEGLKADVRFPVLAVSLLAFGWLLYSPVDRFNDGSEYALPQKDWETAHAYLDSLTPSDLIITERDDSNLLINPYPYEGTDAFSGKVMAAFAPYGKTHVLFNPYYPRAYTTDIFLATLKEARDKGLLLLSGPGNAVFFRTAWSRSPVTDLMLCPALEKTVLTFPPITGHALTREDIYGSYLSVMIISKESLAYDVLPAASKGRTCLDGKHDMVHGLRLAKHMP